MRLSIRQSGLAAVIFLVTILAAVPSAPAQGYIYQPRSYYVVPPGYGYGPLFARPPILMYEPGPLPPVPSVGTFYELPSRYVARPAPRPNPDRAQRPMFQYQWNK